VNGYVDVQAAEGNGADEDEVAQVREQRDDTLRMGGARGAAVLLCCCSGKALERAAVSLCGYITHYMLLVPSALAATYTGGRPLRVGAHCIHCAGQEQDGGG
jgi:hypothetical protein